jgi:hypothetical protein
MSERPSYPETGCGLSIEVWLLLDSETRGGRERKGVEGIESKTGSPA